MAIPHLIKQWEIAKRLKDLEGNRKAKEIRLIIAELAGYKSGPYAELRKELLHELEVTKVRRDVRAADYFAVKREGDFQIGFVGQPSSGKSTIINALSGTELKTADYAFTTLKPKSVVIKMNGVEFQLLDLPGLIEAAAEGKGLGPRIISVIRGLDGIAYVLDATQSAEELKIVMTELEKADIDLARKPSVVIANKIDRLSEIQRASLGTSLAKDFPKHSALAISATESTNLDALRKAFWEMSGFIRVYPKGEAKKAVPMKKGATIEDFAGKIHKDFVEHFKSARVWGPSAKFGGQKVGLNHVLTDTDEIELSIEQF